MKILVIYPYFGTPAGSWSTRKYELTRRWVREGAEVEVITAPYEKSDIRAMGFISLQEVEQIKLTVINSADNNRLSTFHRAWRAIVFSFLSIYFALTRKYDIILASSGPITVGLPMILAKIFRKKKTVFEVRDLWPEGAIQLRKIKSKTLISMAQWFEAKCYKYADLVVAASPGMEEGVKSVAPEAKTLVIPNASDLELFDIPSTEPEGYIKELVGKKIILYAGSLGFMDDIETAILAMREFTNSPLALVIIGDGAERDKLQEMATKVNNPNIYFFGLLPKTEVVKWYSIATASLVGFKDYEVLGTCSPNKMFDSFAAGVPVIQNTKGWIQDLIVKNECGFNAFDYAGYVVAFKKILNDEKLYEMKKAGAFSVARTFFNRDSLAVEYLKEMRDL